MPEFILRATTILAACVLVVGCMAPFSEDPLFEAEPANPATSGIEPSPASGEGFRIEAQPESIERSGTEAEPGSAEKSSSEVETSDPDRAESSVRPAMEYDCTKWMSVPEIVRNGRMAAVCDGWVPVDAQ